jgi:hypothetical protein
LRWRDGKRPIERQFEEKGANLVVPKQNKITMPVKADPWPEQPKVLAEASIINLAPDLNPRRGGGGHLKAVKSKQYKQGNYSPTFWL